MMDWVTLRDLAIPLHGAMFDVVNYFYKVPLAEANLAKLKWRDNKNKVCDTLEKRLSSDSDLFKKAKEIIDPYPDTGDLFKKYDGKVMALVSLFNPTDNKVAEISDLHKRGRLPNYLPWVTMGLNGGAIAHKKQILANSPNIGGVHLFPMGSDKFENIGKMVKALPAQYEIVIIKDFYSTFEHTEFPTLLKVIDDHYKTGAGATGVPIKINTNINWINTNSFKGKLLAEYQEMMYSLAMYQRNGLDTVNFVSGAFSIWDRQNLEDIFDKVSPTKRWLGEDYELSVRSFCNGRSVRFDNRFEVLTKHSPNNWDRFLKLQQRAWVEALMTVSNDLFFEPAKYVAKEGIKSLTFKKKTNPEFKKRFSPSKALRNTQMLYEFYGMNYITQCLMYFPKMLGAAVLGVSMLNNVDWLYKTNIFPETLFGISTNHKTSLYYMGALSALTGFHLFRSDLGKKRKKSELLKSDLIKDDLKKKETRVDLVKSYFKNKGRRLFTTLTYPFFMYTHQIVAYFPGGMKYLRNLVNRNVFNKKNENRIEEFLNTHTIIYPQSILNPDVYRNKLEKGKNVNYELENITSELLENDVESLSELLDSMVKSKSVLKKLRFNQKNSSLEKMVGLAVEFTNYFYKTDYEIELMVALIDEKYSSAMKLKKSEIVTSPVEGYEINGIFNLSGKELGAYNMHDFTRFLGGQFPKEDGGAIVFNAKPNFKQSGYMIPLNEKELICLYHIQEFNEALDNEGLVDDNIDSSNLNLVGSEVYCVKYSYDKKLGSYKLDHKPKPTMVSQGFNNQGYENRYDLESLELFEAVGKPLDNQEDKKNNLVEKIKKVLKVNTNPLQYSSVALVCEDEDLAIFNDIVFSVKGADPYL